jgi:hypothetical protein
VSSVWIVAAVGLLAVSVLLIAAITRRAATPSRYAARSALTPGSLNPDVTQATIETTICVRGWTKTIRPPSSYTSDLKVEQMRQYGFTGSPSQYEEDHFISLELGGHPTDARNLWPERRPQADRVDQVENDLNARVCGGNLSLADAQRKLAQLKHTQG